MLPACSSGAVVSVTSSEQSQELIFLLWKTEDTMKSSIALIILAALCFLALTPQISLGAVYTSGEINPTDNTSGFVLTDVITNLILTSTIIIEDPMKDKIDQVRIEPPEGFLVPTGSVSMVSFAIEGEIKETYKIFIIANLKTILFIFYSPCLNINLFLGSK